MAQLKSQQEFYDDAKTEVQTDAPELTDWTDGSINDILAGVVSSAAREVSLLVVDEFRKTYFDSADGPEVTLGPDYLQALAVDHFGTSFARPQASVAVGVVTFSRPTLAAGSVLIPAGTIVKTQPDATGVSQRFATQIDITMGSLALTVNASVVAVVAGSGGNVGSGMIAVIETALTDNTLTVTNSATYTGGAPAMNDSDYREFIRNRIQTIRGATKSALQAAAQNVPGVQLATLIEIELPVIAYNIATSAPTMGAEYFYIPFTTIYISDANGTASAPLIAAVQAVLDTERAAGVRVNVVGATAVTMSWTASISLNPSGPNYTTLQADTSMITASMAEYVKGLAIGASFSRTAANAALLAIWGPSGTGDLTAFTTTAPSGDVVTTVTQKIIPGTMETA